MKWKRYLLPFLTFLSIICICYYFVQDAIPNQEGYYEISWNLTYRNFSTILATQVTPLNYLLPYTLVNLTPISLHGAWKILDMFFGGLTGAFLVYLYQKHNSTSSLYQKLLGPLLVLSSLGLVYPLTSQTGEGLAVFSAIVGMYLWVQHAFIIGAIFFLVSFLSKYTIYLIAPAVFVWTVQNLSFFPKSKKKNLVLGGMIFFIFALIYIVIKNGNDIAGQASYSSFSPLSWLKNIPTFIYALALGGPIIFFMSFIHSKRKNLFWLGAVGALFLLFTRYYYWHYPYQVLIFLAAYVLQSPKIIQYISPKVLALQIVFTLSLYLLLPIKIQPIGGSVDTIYPKHQTFTHFKYMEKIILTDYHGGKVGYYMNRPFNEPFPAYELSYIGQDLSQQMAETEYLVIPQDVRPINLTWFPECEYLWQDAIEKTSLYRVRCRK